MCCTVLDIAELSKPAGTRCPDCTPRKGCNVYKTRPEPCRAFECAYIQLNALPKYLKPSRAGFVLTANRDSSAFVAHVQEGRDHTKGKAGRWLLETSQSVPVILVRGDRRTAYGPKAVQMLLERTR